MRYKLAKWLVKNRPMIQAAMTIIVIAAEGVRELVRERGRRTRKLRGR